MRACGSWDPDTHAHDRGVAVHETELAASGGGALWVAPLDIILLEPGLALAERRARLTHELMHSEIGAHDENVDAEVLVAVEETVDRLIHERFVPADVLRVVLEELPTFPDPVGPVADHFGVPLWVARSALDSLVKDEGMPRYVLGACRGHLGELAVLWSSTPAPLRPVSQGWWPVDIEPSYESVEPDGRRSSLVEISYSVANESGVDLGSVHLEVMLPERARRSWIEEALPPVRLA